MLSHVIAKESSSDDDVLARRYAVVRNHTEKLIETLTPEDMVVQSMPDASPAKWHLAHTTWFFETFILQTTVEGYSVFNGAYAYLFNSYYDAVGPRHPRAARGLMTRPSIDNVLSYRSYVDEHIRKMLNRPVSKAVKELIELGIAHEEQHQELLLMDILHMFNTSSLKPAFDAAWPKPRAGRRGRYTLIEPGIQSVGHSGEGFAFDHEGPNHQVLLSSYAISDRLVTNGQWLEFMQDGGYEKPVHWLADGWATVQTERWVSPLYWMRIEQEWMQMTLRGLEAIDPEQPVLHVSYYEAAAFADWAKARLPTEYEWEVAAELGVLEQAFDVAWQWTQSAFSPYPKFRPASGAIGEYNGKFMVNVMVLRGGAGITPQGHSRTTYRNFFGPEKRWMMSGVRLARDVLESDFSSTSESRFAKDVISGLSGQLKSLPPKYFYDAQGSQIFEEICATEEYYPTRSEAELLKKIGLEITNRLVPGTGLVEFGSGASEKTRILLDAAAQNIEFYVPVDISPTALSKASQDLCGDYPRLKVIPIIGDFTQPFELPGQITNRPVIGFFPGSTIGNFTHDQAINFLISAREMLGKGATFIVGVDLVKDVDVLTAAYDDVAGVTARFNKNILAHINNKLSGSFNLSEFEHLAVWNETESRVEMYLVSQSDHQVTAANHTFTFAKGERIHTENSHKFTPKSFADLAAKAGWIIQDVWISEHPEFGIFSLQVDQGAG
jgi:dimethylhistidine N-methyltransferase